MLSVLHLKVKAQLKVMLTAVLKHLVGSEGYIKVIMMSNVWKVKKNLAYKGPELLELNITNYNFLKGLDKQ